MNNYQVVIRAEDRYRYRCLRYMRQLLKQHYDEISELIKTYSEVSCTINNEVLYSGSWQVPLSTFVNFRDALFHYYAAYNHEEVFSLNTERSRLEEHLDRAVKDAVVFFLKQLGNKLESLWKYSLLIDSSERSSDVVAVDTDCIKNEFYSKYKQYKQYEQTVSESELTNVQMEIVDFLHNSYANVLRSRKSILQNWMHRIRNYELSTRCSCWKENQEQGQNLSPIDRLKSFQTIVKECNKALEDKKLFEAVYWFADFLEISVETSTEDENE